MNGLNRNSESMLLTADWVVPVVGDPFCDGAILVEDGAITAIGPADQIEQKAGPSTIRKDFGHAALLPGLVNAHTHLEQSIFRGLADTDPFIPWILNLTERSARLSSEQRLVSARIGALEAIRSGTTSVGDISRDGSAVIAAAEAGLRGVVFHEIREMDTKKTREVLRGVDESIAEYKGNKSSIVEIGLFPDATYSVGPEVYRALCHWARERGVILGTHLASGPAEREFVKYGATQLATSYRSLMGWGELLWQPMGCSPVKYLEQWDVLDGPLIATNVVSLTDEDLDLLLNYGVKIVSCPRSAAKLGAGTPPIGRIHRRNMPRGLGTDTVAATNNMDLFDEMRIGLLLHRGSAERMDFGLVAKDFLWMATMGGAEVLGIDHLAGSLEAGKRADIIAVDISGTHQTPVREICSAIVYAANEEDVLLTMTDGRILFERGVSAILDEEAVLAAGDHLRRSTAG